MTQTIEAQGTRLPFTKLKPGMRVVIQDPRGAGTLEEVEGTLLDKHNGSKTLHVLFDGEDSYGGIPYVNYVGTPEPHPLDQIHPMLAKDISKRKTLSVEETRLSSQYVWEEKYDGERQILTYIPNGYAPTGGKEYVPHIYLGGEFVMFRASTRVVGKNTGRLSTNSASIAHLARMPVPTEGPTVLDVELLHEAGFQTLRSIMGSLPERAIQLQDEKGSVYAVVFDLLWFNGRDLRDEPFSTRRRILESWYEDSIEGTVYTDHLLLSDVAATPTEKQELLDRILARGGEGAMVKDLNGKYTDTTRSGRRSSDVLKIKPFCEDDVIIYGFEQGKGEYNQHKYGAIKFAQWVREEDLTPEMAKNGAIDLDAEIEVPIGGFYYIVHMGTCSGITDQMEEMFRAAPENFIGKVMEVRFQQRWSDTGLMRHPNFVRLRGDKTPAECVYGRDR